MVAGGGGGGGGGGAVYICVIKRYDERTSDRGSVVTACCALNKQKFSITAIERTSDNLRIRSVWLGFVINIPMM